MKSAPRVPSFAVILLLAAGLPACNAAQAQPPPPPPPPAPAAAPKAPAAKAPAQDAEEAKLPRTWSDPRVVEQLVQDCRFDPDALKDEEERQKWQGIANDSETEVPGMTCIAALEQSCDDDPCYSGPDGAIACSAKCTAGCRTCGKTCAVDCHKCKSKCVDHACRVACAQGCAACHETCTRTRDRCSTGACKQNYRACWDTLAADWRKKGCAKVCDKLAGCVEGCMKRGKEQAPCEKRCMPKETNGCELGYCSRGDYQATSPVDR